LGSTTFAPVIGPRTDGEIGELFHDFIHWLQNDLGRFGPEGQSWSNQLHESLFMWNVVEGTHVLTIMFFAGTIWLIDLRMMGLAFRNMPFSKLNDRVLPITMISFGVMVLTGAIAFIGRDPMLYYHNIWFRLKMIFLILAAINIFWFHYTVQKSQADWDAAPEAAPAARPWSKAIGPLVAVALALAAAIASIVIHPVFDAMLVLLLVLSTLAMVAALVWLLDTRSPYPPLKVKLSGAISLTCWFLVIVFGRFIAYDWFYCEKVEKGTLMYVLEECKQALSYLEDVDVSDGGEATTEEEAPAEESTDDPAAPEGEAPSEPAPEQPAAPAEGN
jgi:hypothetical protein